VHLLLYDGVCGLCDRLVQYVLAHDRDRVFHFAALQGAVAREALKPFGVSGELTTLRVLVDYRSAHPRSLTKGRATIFVLSRLGWPWKAAGLLSALPSPLLDAVYDLVARHRYRLGGRYERCLVPPAEDRGRFIDAHEGGEP
jgi:predicted DCC family thiol-disulfide oxidoreductase YuxK